MEVGLVDPSRVKGHFQVIIFSEALLFPVFKNLGKDEVLTSTVSLLKNSFVNQKLMTEILWRAVVSHGRSLKTQIGRAWLQVRTALQQGASECGKRGFSALISIWAAET